VIIVLQSFLQSLDDIDGTAEQGEMVATFTGEEVTMDQSPDVVRLNLQQ